MLQGLVSPSLWDISMSPSYWGQPWASCFKLYLLSVHPQYSLLFFHTLFLFLQQLPPSDVTYIHFYLLLLLLVIYLPSPLTGNVSSIFMQLYAQHWELWLSDRRCLVCSCGPKERLKSFITCTKLRMHVVAWTFYFYALHNQKILNCGAEEDSLESLRLQGDQTS